MHGLQRNGAAADAGGHHLVYFLAWVALRLLLQEPVIIQEKVPAFDVGLLVRFFGALYYIESVVLDPAQFGWPVRRTRRWTIMRHKSKTMGSRSMADSFFNHFNEKLNCSWQVLFWEYVA